MKEPHTKSSLFCICKIRGYWLHEGRGGGGRRQEVWDTKTKTNEQMYVHWSDFFLTCILVFVTLWFYLKGDFI
jgi:hypothetical protein